MAIQKLRPEGFSGQRLVVLPEPVVRNFSQDPLLKNLCPTRAGLYPAASGHGIERPRGIAEAILICCLKGQGWVQKGGIREEVFPDTAFLIPSQKSHSYGAHKEQPWTILWIHFRGTELQNYFHLLNSRKHLRFSTPTITALSDALQHLEEGYDRSHLLLAAAKLRVCLAELHFHLKTEPSRHSATDHRLDSMIQWMQTHLEAPPDLPKLSSQVGLSVSHLSALFRNRTGYSPINYFLRLKIQRACHLLDTTSQSVKEIASILGFDDPYYFSRLFRKIMGVSPLHYRLEPKA